MDWSQVLPYFGPFAAIAVVMYVLFRWMKPRMDSDEKDRRERLDRKSERIRELEQKLEDYARERNEAKDAIIAAFGDVGDGFEHLATDMRALIEDTFQSHEANAADRHRQLLQTLDEHITAIRKALRQHADEISGNNNQ